MKALFDPNSKIYRFGSALTSLMFLNLLVVLTSIPIVTFGASMAAMHTMMLKLYRDEDYKLVRGYFKAFRDNLKQATVIWLIYIVYFAGLLALYLLVNQFGGQAADLPRFFLLGLAYVGLTSMLWSFVLQSRYDNSVGRTVKNSLLVMISNAAPSLVMIVMAMVSVVLFLIPHSMAAAALIGITAPTFFVTMLYSRVFDKLEGVDRSRPEDPAESEA